MIYVAASLWVLVIILLAWGVDRIWKSLAKPQTIRVFLWPGAMLAQIGRVLALLITGAKVIKAPPESGEQGPTADWAPKMPVIGPMVVALVPMTMITCVLYFVGVRLGYAVVEKVPTSAVSTVPPLTLAALWDQLRALLTLSQGTLDALRNADLQPWKLLLFTYLMICFTIRLAPSPGNIRGHVGAIVVIGVAAGLAGTVLTELPNVIQSAWPLLALALGWLLLMLMGSLILRAAVSSAKVILKTD